jgi:hypothetical protein
LLDDPAVTLTLYLRRAARLKNPAPDRVRIVEGDVLDGATLRHAMRDQDIVYANLAGDVAAQASSIIEAPHAACPKLDIALDSLSALIARIVSTPGLYVRCSIGVGDD